MLEVALASIQEVALIDDGMPVVFIATKNSQYDKVVSNIEQVRSRGGHVIAVATEGDTEIARLCESVFYVPDVIEPLQQGQRFRRDPRDLHLLGVWLLLVEGRVNQRK